MNPHGTPATSRSIRTSPPFFSITEAFSAINADGPGKWLVPMYEGNFMIRSVGLRSHILAYMSLFVNSLVGVAKDKVLAVRLKPGVSGDMSP